MNRYQVAVVPGDGIGPEVIREAVKVLDRTATIENFKVDLNHFPFGADHYLETGEALAEGFLGEARS